MWFGAIWSAICAIGLGYYISLYRKARGDVLFLRSHSINSIRELYARMRTNFYLGLAVVQILYTTAGIIYTADPHLRLQTNTPRGDAAILTRSLFFAATIILAGIAIYTDRLRDSLIDKLRITEKPGGDELDDRDS
jgi:hypothetical protein